MFNRRKFVTGLLALPGLAFAKFAPKLQQREGIGIPNLGSWNGMIDRIMDQTKGGVKIQFGNWLVMWTGWKEQLQTIDIAGQWAAFPIDNQLLFNSRSVVYVSTPGSFGVMNLGDQINLSWHWPQPTSEIYLSAPTRAAGLEAMEPYRRISLESLLQLLHNVGSKEGIGQATGDQVFNAWNSLSPRCQFWLAPERYMKANFFDPRSLPDTHGELALRLHRELLGPANILIKT
jgi:hypothetical protein